MSQALEPEAETLARKQRVQAALSQYKKKAGLEVDPVAEASAQGAYDRGMHLMQRVSSQASASHCRQPCVAIPTGTR
jgi:MOSC domain-containing protein YiiM